jgi:hypothetical protein
MYYKTQLQKYAVEWIEGQPKGSKFSRLSRSRLSCDELSL